MSRAIAAGAGILVGVLAGLVPGVHTNLIALLALGLGVAGFDAAVFLVAVAVARSVTDAVPSVFLGASDAVMGVLPGHRLLKKGAGRDAVKCCVAGSVLGLVLGVVLIPVFIVVFPWVFAALKPWLFWVLLAIVIFLVARERSWFAVLVFGLSGFLGVVVLRSVADPLFPLLSGLFGASGLVLSLLEESEIPLQAGCDVVRLKPRALWCSVCLGVLAGSVVTLFPGLGPSQAAALVRRKRTRATSALVMVGALGTVDVVVSLVTFFVLGKARNGAVIAIQSVLGSFSFSGLMYLVGVSCVACGCAGVCALFISGVFARVVEWANYQLVCVFVLVFLVVMSVVLCGWVGLLVLIVSTALGLVAPEVGVSRALAMGCVLVPTLLALA